LPCLTLAVHTELKKRRLLYIYSIACEIFNFKIFQKVNGKFLNSQEGEGLNCNELINFPTVVLLCIIIFEVTIITFQLPFQIIRMHYARASPVEWVGTSFPCRWVTKDRPRLRKMVRLFALTATPAVLRSIHAIRYVTDRE
jgi:hypothetical protein